MVVDSMPAAHLQVRTVTPVKPLTQSKRAVSKWKVVPCPAMRPYMCKVTQLMSPTSEVTNVEVLPPPITGPSWAGHAPLFAGPVRSGDDHVRQEAPMSSGE